MNTSTSEIIIIQTGVLLNKKSGSGTQTITKHLPEAEVSIQGSPAQRHLVSEAKLGWRR